MSVSDEAVLFESRMRTVRIARDRVSTLIRVLEPEAGRKSDDDREASDIGLVLRGGYRVRLQLQSIESDTIVGVMSGVGKCSVPVASVAQLLFGGATLEATVTDYADWTLRDAASPRWGDDQKGPAPDALKTAGRKLEPFELPRLRGQPFRSGDHAGKVLVLLHWATWANPCKRALPDYLEALSSFPADEVVLVGVNRGEAPKAVRDYFKAQRLDGFSTLLDHRLLMFNRLQITSLPTVVIVGRDGTIECVQVGSSADSAENAKRIVTQILAGTWQRPPAAPSDAAPETPGETNPAPEATP